MTPRDRLARLHCVNTLFHALTGHDLYLASQMLEAVETAQAEIGDDPVKAEKFTAALHHLHDRLLGGAPDAGFAFCDGTPENAAGPLFVRAELQAALRRNAPFRQATVMVGNLTNADPVLPSKRPGARREKQNREHADTIAQLRDIAARTANPRSLVTLLFV